MVMTNRVPYESSLSTLCMLKHYRLFHLYIKNIKYEQATNFDINLLYSLRTIESRTTKRKRCNGIKENMVEEMHQIFLFSPYQCSKRRDATKGSKR